MTKTIRIAGYVNDSLVDGPGIRFTIFTQGCPYHCLGCHNPDTWDPKGGEEVEISTLIAKWRQNPLLDGITLSGGEPLFQKEKLLPLIDAALEDGLNIVMYSGNTIEKMFKDNDPITMEILSKIHYLIDGRFLLKQINLDLLYRGSNNQRIIDLKRSKPGELKLINSIHDFKKE
jgi:anaerobic ribonucleoside-triphosphate reductase activating protein